MANLLARKGNKVSGIVCFEIDDEDSKWLRDRSYRFYNKTLFVRLFSEDGVKLVHIARYILAPIPDGMVVDHIDGNPLNNKRENLRICTPQQNAWNMKRRRDSLCAYKGVTKRRDRWAARICHDGKLRHLGVFDTQEEAARAYQAEAKRLFGDFARIERIVE